MKTAAPKAAPKAGAPLVERAAKARRAAGGTPVGFILRYGNLSDATAVAAAQELPRASSIPAVERFRVEVGERLYVLHRLIGRTAALGQRLSTWDRRFDGLVAECAATLAVSRRDTGTLGRLTCDARRAARATLNAALADFSVEHISVLG